MKRGGGAGERRSGFGNGKSSRSRRGKILRKRGGQDQTINKSKTGGNKPACSTSAKGGFKGDHSGEKNFKRTDGRGQKKYRTQEYLQRNKKSLKLCGTGDQGKRKKEVPGSFRKKCEISHYFVKS